MTDRIHWGILGCARIGRRGLIPGIQQSTHGQLVALAGRDAGKAAAWASEFSIPKSYGRYEDLLDDATIDAVYLPLPNDLHRTWTIAAAQAGKHVLCDKPLGLNTDEAEEMAAECRKHGVLLMEGFMWRHQPRTAEVRRLIAGGKIGELRLIRASFSFTIPAGDWRLDPARGGGVLWDVGCYGVDTARLFAGAEPLSVHATGHFGETGVEMTLVGELEFPLGVLAQVDCSFESAYRCQYELIGSQGTLSVPEAFLPPERPKIILEAKDQTEELPCPGTNQYAAMVDHFCLSIRAGRLLPPAEDGVANMRVLDALAGSARRRS